MAASFSMVASGIGAPPKAPMRQCDRSNLAKFGSSRQRLYIAGTISVCVMRCSAASSRKARALNTGISTVVPLTLIIIRMIATSPVTCDAGTASTDTSPSRNAMPYSKCSSE
jgi:hypothetical protein